VGTGTQISVQGFLPSKSLTVTVGGTAATIDSGGTTDTNGSATVIFAVPSVPKGAQSVVVSDGTNSATSDSDFVVGPAVSLSSSKGPVGTTGVALTGTGYIAGETVSATFAGSPLTLSPAGPTVSANGTWSATFTVPAAPYGSQGIMVSDTGGANAATDFTVAASTLTSTSNTATATGLSPTSGAVGVGATLSAQGFPADQVLNVMVGATNATVTSGGTTGGNGSTTLTFTVPSVPGGAQKVVVSDGTISATSGTDFVVTANSPTTTIPIAVVGCVSRPKTDCAGANLSNADLTGADLSGATLTDADLSSANLTAADLSGATLIAANLSSANLTGANLSGVIWGNTTCPDGTVSDWDGDTCVHDLG
jgi:hypothetical protein